MWCCALWVVGWWLISSMLLMVTWNKVVIGIIENVKQIKLWHALLVVATLIVLFGPMCYPNWANCGSNSGGGGTWQCQPDSCGH